MWPLFKLSGSESYTISPLLPPVLVHTRVKEMKVAVLNDSSNALHADNLWPGALVIADYLASNPALAEGKHVLELGAGCALPSIVAAKLQATVVVITDFPDESVMRNIEIVCEENGLDPNSTRDCASAYASSAADITAAATDICARPTASSPSCRVLVIPHRWGDSTQELIAAVESSNSPSFSGKFELVILAELLWKE
jgi:hypothetical protein